MARNKESGGSQAPDSKPKQSQALSQNQNKVRSGSLNYDYPLSEKVRKDNVEHQKATAAAAKWEAKGKELDKKREFLEKEKKFKEDFSKVSKKEETIVAAELIVGKEVATEQEAKEIVDTKIDTVTEKAVDQVPAVVDEMAKDGQITLAQKQEITQALKAPASQTELKGKIRGWFSRHAALLGGLASGAAVKSSIRLGIIAASGGTGWGVAIGAGAIGGGAWEGGKAFAREIKRYKAAENLQALRAEKDPFKQAAILSTLKEAYDQARMDGSPEELAQAGDALRSAELNLKAVLEKGKFASATDQEKLAFLLKVSSENQNAITKTDKKEMQKFIREMSKDLDSKHHTKDIFKAERWKRIGKAAGRGAVFGAIGGAVGYGVAGLVDNYFSAGKELAGVGSTTKAAEVAVAVKAAAPAHEYAEQIGAKGITGAYREMLRDYIIQQKMADPNFAKGIQLEHLVYAEDHLKDLALANGTPTGEGVVKASGAELQQALDKAMQLNEKSVENINELISGKQHFISQAVRAHMTSWPAGELSNPSNDVIQQFVTEVSPVVNAELAKSGVIGNASAEHLATLLTTNLIVEEILIRNTKDGRDSVKDKKTVTQSVEEIPNKDGQAEANVNAIENQEQREQFHAEIKDKLQSAGMSVPDLGFVWNKNADMDEQTERIRELSDQLVASFKKHSGVGRLKSLIIEFNFDKDSLTKLEDRTVKSGGVESIFLRIPSHLSKQEYKTGFKNFFVENSRTKKPASDLSHKAKPDLEPPAIADGDKVNDIGEALTAESAEVEGWASSREELLSKHNYLKQIDVAHDVEDDNNLSPSQNYKNIDKIFTHFEEKGLLDETRLAKLQRLALVKKVPQAEARAEHTLYIKLPFRYDTEEDQKAVRGMLVRNIDQINSKNKNQINTKNKINSKVVKLKPLT
jgi:hypothetical protein